MQHSLSRKDGLAITASRALKPLRALRAGSPRCAIGTRGPGRSCRTQGALGALRSLGTDQ